ncbi:MAG: hypothetical protein ABIJ46_01735 [bacterium]
MWFRGKEKTSENATRIQLPVVVALAVSAVSLALAIGVARWSWLILDEQVRLRDSYEDLRMRQEQVEIQYEFWLQQIEKRERDQ